MFESRGGTMDVLGLLKISPPQSLKSAYNSSHVFGGPWFCQWVLRQKMLASARESSRLLGRLKSSRRLPSSNAGRASGPSSIGIHLIVPVLPMGWKDLRSRSILSPAIMASAYRGSLPVNLAYDFCVAAMLSRIRCSASLSVTLWPWSAAASAKPLPIASLYVDVPLSKLSQLAWPLVHAIVTEFAPRAAMACSATAHKSPSNLRAHGRFDRSVPSRMSSMPATALQLSSAMCKGPGLANAAMTLASSARVELLYTPGIAPAMDIPGGSLPPSR